MGGRSNFAFDSLMLDLQHQKRAAWLEMITNHGNVETCGEAEASAAGAHLAKV